MVSPVIPPNPAPPLPPVFSLFDDWRVVRVCPQLKVQEAMIKKERFDREHEDILREIRHGLLRYGGGGGGGSAGGPGGKPQPRERTEETYMYDEDMLKHWYDEPPYESDPEELLMEHANNRWVRACVYMYMYSVYDVG